MKQQGEAETNQESAAQLIEENVNNPASADQSTSKNTRNERKSVDERLAEYTKWLMIGTAILSVATIGLFIATVGLWRYAAEQAHDMKESITAAQEGNRIAQEALFADRAWIGASDAMLRGGTSEGIPIQLLIKFNNTGRSPGLTTFTRPQFLWMQPEDPDTEEDIQRFDTYVNNCLLINPPRGGMLVYPSQESNAYQSEYTIPPTLIPKEFHDNKKALAIQGCMAYLSNGKYRHTAYCFFYRKDVTNREHLSVCRVGNQAD